MPPRKARTTAELKDRQEGRACAGCLTSFAKKGYIGGRGTPIAVGKGRKVEVCWGRGQQPSDRCTLLARERESRCPGCDAGACPLGTICNECTRALERGKTLEARKMEWWGVLADGLGPYLSEAAEFAGGDWKHPMDDLAKLLCEAVAAGRTVERGDREAPQHHRREVMATIPSKLKGIDHSRTHVVYVELVKGQGAALEALVEAIRSVMRKQYEEGFEKGGSILRRLAGGERGILESERDLEQAREQHARDDERYTAREVGEDD